MPNKHRRKTAFQRQCIHRDCVGCLNTVWGDIMKKTKKGFTLVELIVVIAIIGTLAAIIVPAIMGYVREANKRADCETARQFGERIETEMVKDDDLFAKFSYAASGSKTIYRGVYGTIGGVTEAPYDIFVVTKIRGVKNGYYPTFESGSNTEWKPYARILDQLFDTSNGNPAYKMRATKHNGITTDEWLICHRLDDPDKIEIWAGSRYDDSSHPLPWATTNGWGCNPRYRLWPNPDDEYTGFD